MNQDPTVPRRARARARADALRSIATRRVHHGAVGARCRNGHTQSALLICILMVRETAWRTFLVKFQSARYATECRPQFVSNDDRIEKDDRAMITSDLIGKRCSSENEWRLRE